MHHIEWKTGKWYLLSKDSMKLYNGDCFDKMGLLDDNTIDTIITDPPYGLSFMGKKWDYDVPKVEIWEECLRVLKPGGTLLCFAGSRTQHRMACNVEDAGFILKDTIMWIYGSGFPKATNISKQLDKGHKREVVGETKFGSNFQNCGKTGRNQPEYSEGNISITAPATPEALLWNGWKSHGLKPAYEPILVAMKPNDGTYAENALKWGVSGLWIDGARIEGEPWNRTDRNNCGSSDSSWSLSETTQKKRKDVPRENHPQGRFPSNIILDEEAGAMLDEQSGVSKSTGGKGGSKSMGNQGYGFGKGSNFANAGGLGDSGGASRFFYCAKSSKAERNAGCEGLPLGEPPASARSKPAEGRNAPLGEPRTNHHPTVKPLALMEYLCTLTKTPTGGIVLDPFMGSGTTGVACRNTGRDFIGIELDPDYFQIAQARINKKENLLF